MNKHILNAFLTLTISSLAHAKTFNLIEPDIGWSKKEVRVCFADSSHVNKSRLIEKDITKTSVTAFTPVQKAAIKKIITQEYTKERTGISYTGWKDCRVDPDSDAYIFRVIDPKITLTGVATMGESGVIGFVDQGADSKIGRVYRKNNEEKTKPHVALNTYVMNTNGASPIEHLQLAAVHEFGHLSGLDHEHMDLTPDKQRYPDRNCETTRLLIKDSEVPYLSTKKVSVYDTNSVMNYCFIEIVKEYSPNFVVAKEDLGAFELDDKSLIKTSTDPDGILFEVKIGLSLGDVHALKCQYVYDKETQDQICVPTYDPRLKTSL